MKKIVSLLLAATLMAAFCGTAFASEVSEQEEPNEVEIMTGPGPVIIESDADGLDWTIDLLDTLSDIVSNVGDRSYVVDTATNYDIHMGVEYDKDVVNAVLFNTSIIDFGTPGDYATTYWIFFNREPLLDYMSENRLNAEDYPGLTEATTDHVLYRVDATTTIVPIQEIGDPSASIDIMLTNEMGDVITGLSVRSPSETEFPNNMMTADQKIEDKESVKLFYEPVTVQDVASAEDGGVLPYESYVGYWNESDDVDETGWELTIFEVTDKFVIFHLWGYRTADSDNYIIATFDSQNVGSFLTYLNGDKKISGTITFYNGSVVVTIEQSEFQMTTPYTFVFDEKHDLSREEGNNSPLDQWEEDRDYVYFVAGLETDVMGESTYSLQVTMENGDVYDLIDFDVEDMSEVTLYLEDGVAYIEYMSLSQNILINTKEAEMERKLAGQANTDADRDEEAYEAGYYCGDNAYTDEDAEARAAELGYESGSKSYQDFWDGYADGFWNRNEGDFYIIGYRFGQEGHSEEEATVYLTSDGTVNDPKSQYMKDYWRGYYEGYAEFEAEQEIYIYSQANLLGENQGHMGHSLELAESVLKEDMGITSSDPYYQSFLDGYYYGWSLYEEDCVNLGISSQDGITEDNYYGEWDEEEITEDNYYNEWDMEEQTEDNYYNEWDEEGQTEDNYYDE